MTPDTVVPGTCVGHSGLVQGLKSVKGEVERVRETTEKIWDRLEEVGKESHEGDVQRRVADAVQSTRLSMWRTAATVLGIIAGLLALVNKYGLPAVPPAP